MCASDGGISLVSVNAVRHGPGLLQSSPMHFVEPHPFHPLLAVYSNTLAKEHVVSNVLFPGVLGMAPRGLLRSRARSQAGSSLGTMHVSSKTKTSR